MNRLSRCQNGFVVLPHGLWLANAPLTIYNLSKRMVAGFWIASFFNCFQLRVFVENRTSKMSVMKRKPVR